LKDAVNNNGGFQVGSIGESIGLKTGDKIIKINGHDYDYFQDLVKPETLLSDGASYTVDRNGQIIDIPLPADFIQKFNRKEGLKNFLWFRYAPVVDELEPKTIAAKVGLQKGDLISSINGQPVQFHDQVSALVNDTVKFSKDSISFSVVRGGQTISFKEAFPEGVRRSIGFYPAVPTKFIEQAEKKVEYGFAESIPMGTERAFTTLVTQVKAFGKIFSGVLSPKESLSGPIGIMQAFGKTWDWERFWSLTGVLSLVLAFMNLLPIPALDGGHVMFLSYEIISRRKPSDKFLENAQKVGMVFLLTLMVLIFANDIIKLF
jgi:regulator of sigma E protease